MHGEEKTEVREYGACIKLMGLVLQQRGWLGRWGLAWSGQEAREGLK
jgi:hypothetical protein